MTLGGECLIGMRTALCERRQCRYVHVIGCLALLGPRGHHFIGRLQMVAEAFGIEERRDIALFLEMRLVFGDRARGSSASSTAMSS